MELRKFLRYIGFLEFESRYGRKISLILRIPGFSLLILAVITTVWFLIFEASTFAEQTQSIETCEAYSFVLTMYTIFILRRQDFFQMIKIIEKRIGERKYFANFRQFSEKKN